MAMTVSCASHLEMKALIDAATIQERVAELGAQIRECYGEEPVLLICILKGSFVFLADLCRHLDSNVTVDFMQVSSYGDGTKSSGIVQILKDIDVSLEGKHVLLVEDIVDTGSTLAHLRDLLHLRQPQSLRVVALLSKPAARKVQVPVEFLGFEIGNEFVVGYGLDVAERFRNLPFVAVLHQEN